MVNVTMVLSPLARHPARCPYYTRFASFDHYWPYADGVFSLRQYCRIKMRKQASPKAILGR
jgi:hypothetical protein